MIFKMFENLKSSNLSKGQKFKEIQILNFQFSHWIVALQDGEHVSVSLKDFEIDPTPNV